jgi:hypothetical protein
MLLKVTSNLNNKMHFSSWVSLLDLCADGHITKSGPANYVMEQHYQCSLEIKQYKAEEVPNHATSISNFVKIGQLLQTLKQDWDTQIQWSPLCQLILKGKKADRKLTSTS